MADFHKYVFDTGKRPFVAKFEEMYRAEDSEGFDSWFERDLRHLRKTISYSILSAYNFSSVLNVGCGKGTFTHLLKKQNNRVLGIDSSETAIQKARVSYPDIEFRCVNAHDLISLNERFDLVVTMGTFAYVDGWPRIVEAISTISRWFYVAEYVPPNPIGFVKSPDGLVSEVRKYFTIRTKVVLDDEHCMLLGESKNGDSVS